MGALFSNPNTGAIAGGVGDLVEGFAGGRAADFQAQIARNNAQISRYNAQQATEAGNAQAINSMLRTRAQVGQTKAAQAASGIDVNTGSAADVQASERMLGMLDALTIRSNAARAAYGYRAEAGVKEAQAKLYGQRGKMSRIAGLMAGSGTILEGATSADRQRKIWQDTYGSLEEDASGDTIPTFGGLGDYGSNFERSGGGG